MPPLQPFPSPLPHPAPPYRDLLSQYPQPHQTMSASLECSSRLTLPTTERKTLRAPMQSHGTPFHTQTAFTRSLLSLVMSQAIRQPQPRSLLPYQMTRQLLSSQVLPRPASPLREQQSPGLPMNPQTRR